MKYFSILILFISFQSSAQIDVLMDDFQSGIPLYYTMINNDGLTPATAVSEYTNAWISKEDPDDATNKVASSTSFFNPAGSADRWLITPQLNLGAFGNFLSWQAKSHDASFPENYFVLLSTTDNQIASFTDTIIEVYQEPEYWTTHTVNLSELGYDSESIHLAIVLRSYDSFKIYVDSLHVWKEEPVGLKELSSTAIDFTVAPNPTSDLVKINCSTPIESVKIIGVNGEVFLEGTSKTIFLSNLSSGVYFVEITTNTGIARKRIVKI